MLQIKTTDRQVVIIHDGIKTGCAKGELGYSAYPNNLLLRGYPDKGSQAYFPWGEVSVNGTIATPENINALMDDIVGKQGGGAGTIQAIRFAGLVNGTNVLVHAPAGVQTGSSSFASNSRFIVARNETDNYIRTAAQLYIPVSNGTVWPSASNMPVISILWNTIFSGMGFPGYSFSSGEGLWSVKGQSRNNSGATQAMRQTDFQYAGSGYVFARPVSDYTFSNNEYLQFILEYEGRIV